MISLIHVPGLIVNNLPSSYVYPSIHPSSYVYHPSSIQLCLSVHVLHILVNTSHALFLHSSLYYEHDEENAAESKINHFMFNLPHINSCREHLAPFCVACTWQICPCVCARPCLQVSNSCIRRGLGDRQGALQFPFSPSWSLISHV